VCIKMAPSTVSANEKDSMSLNMKMALKAVQT
jgi:hypothetical protein